MRTAQRHTHEEVLTVSYSHRSNSVDNRNEIQIQVGDKTSIVKMNQYFIVNLLLSIYGIINQEPNSPIYQVLHPPVRAFSRFALIQDMVWMNFPFSN